MLGAKTGDKGCQYKLGYIYDGGHGVKPNIKKAIYWYKKSDEKNESFAIAYNLALIYRDIGEKEMELKYLRRAAELGDDHAKRELDNPEKEAARMKRQQNFRIKERIENANGIRRKR